MIYETYDLMFVWSLVYLCLCTCRNSEHVHHICGTLQATGLISKLRLSWVVFLIFLLLLKNTMHPNPGCDFFSLN